MKCARCSDTGWLEFTGGTHRTYGNTLNPAGQEIEATPERPFWKRCSCKRTPAEDRQREVREYT